VDEFVEYAISESLISGDKAANPTEGEIIVDSRDITSLNGMKIRKGDANHIPKSRIIAESEDENL